MSEMLKIEDLKKSFKVKGGIKEVLKGINLLVEKGEIYGFLGPNGAGKSTTIKIIMGFIKKDGGDVFIKGRNHEERDAKSFIGFMPEHPYYPDTLTALEYLDFVCNIYKVRSADLDKLLSEFELIESKRKLIRNFSKGMIQRLGFISALIHDPDIYILDEPMSGLDPVGRYLFKEKMLELKSRGKSIFFSSHIIPDIEEICDRVGFIKDGKIVKELKRSEFKHFFTEAFNLAIKGPIEKLKGQYSYTPIEENMALLVIPKNEIYLTMERLKDMGLEIVDIEPIKKDLEKLFVELFGDRLNS